MKKAFFAILILLLPVIEAHSDVTMQFRRFGTVRLYSETQFPKHVIIFLSGDGGWNKKTVEKAKYLAKLDSLIVGIDVMYYLKHMTVDPEGCYDPAQDFSALSKVVQNHLHYPSHVPAILLGYSLGSTLVYGTLAQSEPHTFAGAISMGFCPDMPLDKPFCRGQGLDQKPYSTAKEKGFLLSPAQTLQDWWLVFQGAQDEVCTDAATAAFVKQVPHSEYFSLPNVGHGFRVEANWMPEFKQAFQRFESQPH